MERIGQSDVATILGRLHQELKSQTRDSKAEQHLLMRKAFHYVTAAVKPSGANVQARKLNEVTHRVLQELFALLVGDSGFAPPRIRILSAALVRELSLGEVPYFFRDNFNGNFQLYDQNKARRAFQGSLRHLKVGMSRWSISCQCFRSCLQLRWSLLGHPTVPQRMRLNSDLLAATSGCRLDHRAF